MRESVLAQARSYEAASSSGLLSTLLRNWIARRAVARMASLDEHLLDDIGVTRNEVLWAANLPLSRNAAVELQERARTRRRQELNR